MMRRNPGKLILAVSLLGALAAAGALARQAPSARSAEPSQSQKSQPTQTTKPAGQAQSAQPASAPAAKPGSSTAPAKAAEFPPDKVVLKVGSEQVTAADLDFVIHLLSPQVQGQIAAQGRKPFGDWYSMLIALSQKTAGQHLEDTPDFRRQMNLARMQFLAQDESKTIADGAAVTPEDIKQYFAAHQSDYAALEIRQVTIRKKLPHGGNAAP